MQGGEDREKPGYKVVVLGSSAVGKTSLVMRFVRDEFSDAKESTIGAAFLSTTVVLPTTDETVKFDIWDTAGQERYQSLTPMYYRGAMAVIIVYSVDSAESYNKAKQWVTKLENESDVGSVRVLVGNKCDLDVRDIESKEAEDFALRNNLFFFETSAKTKVNVEEMFIKIGKELNEKKNEEPKEPTGGVTLKKPVSGDSDSGGDGGCPC